MNAPEPIPFVSQLPVEISEDAIARAFSARHGETLRFDHDVGRWFEWDGGRWRQDGTGKAFSYCRELAREASIASSANRLQAARKASFAAGVERFARSDPIHAVTQAAWDADPWLLGCPGTTVDLRDCSTRQPDPADGITRQTAVAPLPDTPHVWETFLHEATGGDAAMVRFLQQWCGYSLTGDTREHALLFVYGPGGNGKSVFLNTVSRILGDYAATAAMDTFAASRSERHPTDLASLRGARFVSASETEEGKAWAEARIKAMTGGDPIAARFMRQDFFTFLPQFKLTIVGNHKPILRNVDDAARRRFNIVPFEHTPARPDRQLEEKLKAEWPAILGWMIQGCVDWKKNGLVRPESVVRATAAYFSDQDIFGQWLEDECIAEPANNHRWELTGDLFAAWLRYAKNAGEEPGTQNLFAEHMTRRGFEKKLKRVGSQPKRVWLGISLNRPAAGGV